MCKVHLTFVQVGNGVALSSSTERILTTHTGSLPRPSSLADRHDPAAIRSAVAEIVGLQVTAGIDIVNDGEASKQSYATYVTERLSGFEGGSVPLEIRGLADFPEFARKMQGDRDREAMMTNPSCSGPVGYLDRATLDADIANLKAAAGDAQTFMTAASPGVIEFFMPNRYYPSTEAYLFALADAMKLEYDAIYRAGLMLQIDCPDLASAWAIGPERTLADFRMEVAQRLEAVDYATRDIPTDRIRIHLCWGNYEGPHHTDIPLADIIDLVLAARAGAVSFEGANPRHEHEWQVFEDVKLPDGKVLIPGVLDTTTNYIEHPDLVAQRLIRFAEVVGKANVIAGSDCGFAPFADYLLIDPRITWAKLASMAEGARRASGQLWR
jgi:5-methyltetrahydropteroyltriglutamate--homocysteine methyltransferase